MTESKTMLSREAVGEEIRRAIMKDELAPGQRLVKSELCAVLGASRANVHGALMDLTQEGLVERIADRGARVRVISLEEALQITEVRMVVEELCVAKAAEKISAEEIVVLRTLVMKLQERARQGDALGFAELTHRIRENYVRIADQPVAAAELARFRTLISRHRFRLTYRAGRARDALPYWLERVDAICQRNPTAARLAVQRHAENAKEAMRALVHERQSLAERSRKPS
jgi:DNA-binding GntR family transcriptional regulator